MIPNDMWPVINQNIAYRVFPILTTLTTFVKNQQINYYLFETLETRIAYPIRNQITVNTI